jgi:hypothetical protein
VTFLTQFWRARREYLHQLRAGCWMQGLFIFPSTGDIVVRDELGLRQGGLRLRPGFMLSTLDHRPLLLGDGRCGVSTGDQESG